MSDLFSGVNYSGPALTWLVTVVVIAAAALRRARTFTEQSEREYSERLREEGIEAEHGRDTDVSETEDAVTTRPERLFELSEQYHAQGLAQSRTSFYISILFAVIGFGVIVWSILIALSSGTGFGDQGTSFITLVAGTVIEAVAALFFTQSNRARQTMVEFFDRLRTDRKLDESLSMLSDIEQQDLRDGLRALLTLHLVDSEQSVDALQTLRSASRGFANADSSLADGMPTGTPKREFTNDAAHHG